MAISSVAMSLHSFGRLSAPAGIPTAVVARICAALTKVLAMTNVRARLEANGSQAAPSTPEQYSEQLRAEVGRAEKLMKAAKLEPT